jgi:hypothetical protein
MRRAEFFRKGGRLRGLVKDRRRPAVKPAVNLDTGKKRQRNQLLARLVKAYLLKESLDRLWNYHYEGAHAAIPTG